MVYYTAITLKLNTKPWKKITSKENYMEQLNWICSKYDCQLTGSIAWELDQCCQLHTHTTLKSKKALFRKNICTEYRKQFKNHNIWLVPDINNNRWDEYCSKSPDEEEKYHWLCRYYQEEYPEQYNNEKAIREGTGHKLDDVFINKTNHWEKLTAEFID